MDATLKLWAVIFAVGAINYLSRLSFIAFFARRAMPPLLERALRYVPPAMLTALIVPMVVDASPGGTDHVAWPKVAAAVIATAFAYFRLGTLWTLGIGMAALWLLQFGAVF
jgi:branched-subunit amino acid transport protein